MAPKSLLSRVESIEDALKVHLIESGSIRSDLAWLKRAFWSLVAVSGTFIASLLVALFSFFLKAH